MLEQIDGIVLKTKDYGETHKLVTIYSGKFGKFQALAKGAKKPKSRMAAVTQPFIFARFFVYLGSGLSTIQQGELLNSHRTIREDFVKTAYCSYIAELTDKLLENKDMDPYIFGQFQQTLEWIEENDQAEIPIMMYELKLYKKAGFAPVLNQCTNCGRVQQPFFFSIVEGGFLCPACRHVDPEAVELSPKFAKLLYLFSEVELERIGTIQMKPENVKKLQAILQAYYERYGGYLIRSRKFLDQLDLFK
ncbi:DNA repair protein RecO [Oceanobacillus sp. J11TS1]|uniref:DNA repair protein RecO n=1 Tax=Oceanobacillus sp. J11TS1 TaxID=2807191 RepID=UPI001B0DD0D6|nr:DNA repair protein RecO [Oceanobacillus sp. J11TS1]GIO23105.1 DNA repair protein RecO [Oceanobacillus sp. J11TS1]